MKLSKICNDLLLLSSGPRAGFGEINLPPMQTGSSIMPGKVNPVIPEMVNQVCFDIIGGDVTVTMAAEEGQLQLNVFEPIIAFRLLSGMADTDIAKVALETGRGVYDLVCERGLMTRDQLDRLLNPEAMTAPRATPATDR